jgi:hypothetical protein
MPEVTINVPEEIADDFGTLDELRQAMYDDFVAYCGKQNMRAPEAARCRTCSTLKNVEWRRVREKPKRRFPRAISTLTRVKVLSEADRSSEEGPRYLVQCPKCGTSYKHIAWTLEQGVDEEGNASPYYAEYYIRIPDPFTLAVRYFTHLERSFPEMRLLRIAVDPEKARTITVRVLSPYHGEQESALSAWAETLTKTWEEEFVYCVTLTIQQTTLGSDLGNTHAN